MTTFADYRKALRDHRIPKEVTDRIIEAMHVSDDLIGNYRRLFDLPDEALAIADRANLPEKLLRYVRDVKDSKWQVRIVRQAAGLGLSAEKVNWWTRQADLAQAEHVLRGKKSAQSPSSKSPINAPREWGRQLEKLTSPELLQVSRKDIQTIATEYAKHGDAKRIRKTIKHSKKSLQKSNNKEGNIEAWRFVPISDPGRKYRKKPSLKNRRDGRTRKF